MALQFNNETNILEYIHNNVDAINNYQQEGFEWGKEDLIRNYQGHEIVKTLTTIPDVLDRNAVVQCYKNDLYAGFIATLLWGGYHRGQHIRKKFTDIINLNQQEIKEKLSRVESLLLFASIQKVFFTNKILRVEKAFYSMMSNGENKILNIGVSYFTKILYFLAKRNSISPLPLIFDLNMRYVHIALLKANQNEGDSKLLQDFYPLKGKKYMWKKAWLSYSDFLKRMCQIAVIEHINSAEVLEEALFGWSRKNDMSNPRNVVEKFISQP